MEVPIIRILTQIRILSLTGVQVKIDTVILMVDLITDLLLPNLTLGLIVNHMALLVAQIFLYVPNDGAQLQVEVLLECLL